jgi:hypothetical protein
MVWHRSNPTTDPAAADVLAPTRPPRKPVSRRPIATARGPGLAPIAEPASDKVAPEPGLSLKRGAPAASRRASVKHHDRLTKGQVSPTPPAR